MAASISNYFYVKEHMVEAQHIREYPNATAHSQEETLYLAVKQYVPRSNPAPQPGDVTIVAAHANGFVKELYEPLWEDLVQELDIRGVKVRGIWIADVAHQGQSGMINEASLGNDPSWWDHSRDLLHLINQFRQDMVRPLIGVGHSFGGTIMANLALLHPRLFSSLVLLDPVLTALRTDNSGPGASPMISTVHRRDLWPSRAAAERAFRQNPFYAIWDPRVFAVLIRHGLRDTPTRLHPDAPPQVTLTTTKHQEVFTYYRPTAQGIDADTGQRMESRSENGQLDRMKLPDAEPYVGWQPHFPLYRPEGYGIMGRLPALRPGVLYIFGGTSDISTEGYKQEKMEWTGVGVGGSGGVKVGRVAKVTVEGVGHLIPMEDPRSCAAHAAEFIVRDLGATGGTGGWHLEDADYRVWVRTRHDNAKWTLDEHWMRLIDKAGKRQPKEKL